MTRVSWSGRGVSPLILHALVASLALGALSSPGAAQVVFAPPHNITDATDGTLNGNVLTGDFDEDGTPDVAALDGIFVSQLQVLLGDGLGGFGPLPAQSVAPTSSLRAVVDVDVDGHLDLLVTGHSAPPPTVLVLRGHGDGTFELPLGTSVTTFPSALAADDVNQDGLPDFVTGTGVFGPKLDVWIGHGDATFSKTQSLNSGSFTISSLFLANVDGDAWVDLVDGGSAIGNQAEIFHGNGAGTFATTATKVQVVPSALQDLAVDDVDADGHVDLIATDLGLVAVHLGLGDGSFAPDVTTELAGGQWLVTGDWDGDGVQDAGLLAASPFDLTLLRSLGDGHFAPPVHVTLPSAHLDDVADMDADGRDDILAYRDGGADGGAVLVPNATYTSSEPFLDLGGALHGTAGWPILLCSGSLQAGEPFAFELAVAAPGALPLLVVGNAPSGHAFAGGTLWPQADRILLMPVVDAEGRSAVEGNWPAVLDHVQLWLQIWFEDAGGVMGWASTSGVVANG